MAPFCRFLGLIFFLGVLGGCSSSPSQRHQPRDAFGSRQGELAGESRRTLARLAAKFELGRYRIYLVEWEMGQIADQSLCQSGRMTLEVFDSDGEVVDSAEFSDEPNWEYFLNQDGLTFVNKKVIQIGSQDGKIHVLSEKFSDPVLSVVVWKGHLLVMSSSPNSRQLVLLEVDLKKGKVKNRFGLRASSEKANLRTGSVFSTLASSSGSRLVFGRYEIMEGKGKKLSLKRWEEGEAAEPIQMGQAKLSAVTDEDFKLLDLQPASCKLYF